MTSKLGEEDACNHYFVVDWVDDVHDVGPKLRVVPCPSSVAAIYAVPEADAAVSASANVEVVAYGIHKITTTYKRCACCGAIRKPEKEESSCRTLPVRYSWTASANGVKFYRPSWTGRMSKGTGQAIKFSVQGECPVCSECTRDAKAEGSAFVDVYELSIAADPYIGLDMRDEMKGKRVVRSATANIDPAPAQAWYSWTECGKCQFTGLRNRRSVEYGATNVHWNIDNDDASDNAVGAPKRPGVDYLQTGAELVANEDDLKALAMSIDPIPASGTVRLCIGGDKAKIWGNAKKGGSNLVLGGAGEKSWDLADAGQRQDFNALCSSL